MGSGVRQTKSLNVALYCSSETGSHPALHLASTSCGLAFPATERSRQQSIGVSNLVISCIYFQMCLCQDSLRIKTPNRLHSVKPCQIANQFTHGSNLFHVTATNNCTKRLPSVRSAGWISSRFLGHCSCSSTSGGNGTHEPFAGQSGLATRGFQGRNLHPRWGVQAGKIRIFHVEAWFLLDPE